MKNIFEEIMMQEKDSWDDSYFLKFTVRLLCQCTGAIVPIKFIFK